eukprot:gene21971-26463_t
MSAVVDSQAPEEGLPVADARDKSATPSVERGSGVDSAEAEATPSREAGSEFSEAEYSYFVTSLKDEDNTERTKERTEKRFQRRSRLVSDAYAEISFSYFLLDHPARKLCMRIAGSTRFDEVVQGLRMLVASLLRAVPLLLRVISMFALILILFACFGSRLFKGRLKSICIPNALLPDGYENMLQSDLEHYVRETLMVWILVELRPWREAAVWSGEHAADLGINSHSIAALRRIM